MIVYFPITYEKMFTPFNICGCKYFSTNRHSSYGVNNNYSLIFYKFLYGEAPPIVPALPFHMLFLRKKVPLSYTFC